MDLVLHGAPNPRQVEFFLSRARHTAYGGARGGGKSWAMRRKLVLLAVDHKDLNILLLRRTLPELRENHILPLRRELYGFARYNATERVFVFPTGSRIKLGYCDTSGDVYQYQGQEYDVIGMEEATHFTEEQQQFLTTCNRTSREGFTPRMYYTCNPGNVGHAWVKRLFIDRAFTADERPEDYAFIPARIWDNKALIEADPGYVRQLMALPEDMKRAHLNGDWDVHAGQYFREFSRERHVVPPYDIPRWHRRFRSMDWGYNDPCCVLWHAVGPEGRIVTYRELYVRQMRAEDVAKRVKDLTGDEEIAYTVASPDLWQNRGQLLKTAGGFEGETLAEIFMKSGMPLIPADNTRVAGWQRVRDHLAADASGEPRWQCFSDCANLIRTLPMLQYDSRNREDAADGEDHAPEALRYGLMSRPSPAGEPVKKKRRGFDPLDTGKPATGGYMST